VTPGSTGPAGPTPGEAPDLDRLIGDVEAEGARRRAAPDFPHDRAARLGLELDRQAPAGTPAPDVAAALAEAEAAVARLVEAVADGVPAHAGTRGRRARERRLEHLEHLLAATGLALAGAVRVLGTELARLAGPGTGAGSGEAAPVQPGGFGADDALAAWRPRLAEHLPTAGRVLVAGTGALVEDVVGDLRAGGVDAYGVTTSGPELRSGPDVRHGTLLEHVRAVGDGGLGAVVVTGVADALTPGFFEALVPELVRCAQRVVVVSSAPWWWRRALGAPAADTAGGRPFEPDTWIEALARRGLEASAAYDGTGHSYRVVAGAPGP